MPRCWRSSLTACGCAPRARVTGSQRCNAGCGTRLKTTSILGLRNSATSTPRSASNSRSPARNCCASRGVAASAVRAIGSHGQTLLHVPRGEHPFTLQIGDPNIIAERLGIDVVADFRRRDLAAGGQGAPLMPAFHAAAFGQSGETRAVINIGGLANVTLLGAGGHVIGFDTGPGNCLLDSWARRHQDRAYDADGAWAASGTLNNALLAQLMREPYFAQPAPKSTGRDLFSDAWLQLALGGRQLAPADVQATLAQLTADTIAAALGAGNLGAPRYRRACTCAAAAPSTPTCCARLQLGPAAHPGRHDGRMRHCRRNTSRRPDSPGWPTSTWPGCPVICPRSRVRGTRCRSGPCIAANCQL
jgi:1,6-anhydro-N-acetylmuramate kinase